MDDSELQVLDAFIRSPPLQEVVVPFSSKNLFLRDLRRRITHEPEDESIEIINEIPGCKTSKNVAKDFRPTNEPPPKQGATPLGPPLSEPSFVLSREPGPSNAQFSDTFQETAGFIPLESSTPQIKKQVAKTQPTPKRGKRKRKSIGAPGEPRYKTRRVTKMETDEEGGVSGEPRQRVVNCQGVGMDGMLPKASDDNGERRSNSRDSVSAKPSSVLSLGCDIRGDTVDVSEDVHKNPASRFLTVAVSTQIDGTLKNSPQIAQLDSDIEFIGDEAALPSQFVKKSKRRSKKKSGKRWLDAVRKSCGGRQSEDSDGPVSALENLHLSVAGVDAADTSRRPVLEPEDESMIEILEEAPIPMVPEDRVTAGPVVKTTTTTNSSGDNPLFVLDRTPGSVPTPSASHISTAGSQQPIPEVPKLKSMLGPLPEFIPLVGSAPPSWPSTRPEVALPRSLLGRVPEFLPLRSIPPIGPFTRPEVATPRFDPLPEFIPLRSAPPVRPSNLSGRKISRRKSGSGSKLHSDADSSKTTTSHTTLDKEQRRRSKHQNRQKPGRKVVNCECEAGHQCAVHREAKDFNSDHVQSSTSNRTVRIAAKPPSATAGPSNRRDDPDIVTIDDDVPVIKPARTAKLACRSPAVQHRANERTGLQWVEAVRRSKGEGKRARGQGPRPVGTIRPQYYQGQRPTRPQDARTTAYPAGGHVITRPMEGLRALAPPIDLMSRPLRPVIVDGANVGYRYSNQGNQRVLDFRGVQLVFKYFASRGHEVFVVLTDTLTNRARKDEAMKEVFTASAVVFTPHINQPGFNNVVLYDDRFVVQLAAEKGGVIVSSDFYRDIIEEAQANQLHEWVTAVTRRLLIPTFATGIVLFDPYPYGMSGPRLEELLRF